MALDWLPSSAPPPQVRPRRRILALEGFQVWRPILRSDLLFVPKIVWQVPLIFLRRIFRVS